MVRGWTEDPLEATPRGLKLRGGHKLLGHCLPSEQGRDEEQEQEREEEKGRGNDQGGGGGEGSEAGE